MSIDNIFDKCTISENEKIKLIKLSEIICFRCKYEFINVNRINKILKNVIYNDKIYKKNVNIIENKFKKIIEAIDIKYRKKIKLLKNQMHESIANNDKSNLDNRKLLYTSYYALMNIEKKKFYNYSDLTKENFKKKYIDHIIYSKIKNYLKNNINIANTNTLYNFHFRYYLSNKNLFNNFDSFYKLFIQIMEN